MANSSERKGLSHYFNYIGIAILALCYAGAIWNVFKTSKAEVLDNKKVLRICHWQLEAGFRDGVQTMIDDYEKLHPDVKIYQIPITERAYGQWVTTQLIGRTAPDLIEVGIFNVNSYLGKYFQPLTDELVKPNPYNKDNPALRDVPWMDTFVDGLVGSYIPELLDYYTVGMSMHSVRVFYNKTLFKLVTGSGKGPETYQELIDACEKIKSYTAERNKKIEAFNRLALQNRKWWWKLPFMSPETKQKLILYPIASSRYQVESLKGRYSAFLTADRAMENDTNFDGWAGSEEILRGFLNGTIDLDDEKYKASVEIVKDLAKYFVPGFMSIDRMDAGFAFVQGRAGMITSGSWDANSFIKQVNDQPFGDIILEINGKKPLSAADAGKTLMELKSADIKINREGSEKHVTLKAENGKDLWEAYGMRLGDFKDKKGGDAVVVAEADSVSPASRAGILERKTFEVGIIDFPIPKGDPKYGRFFVGNVAEVERTSGGFGVTKFSKNKDIAIDFLRFCTTPANDEKFNRIVQWLPAVKGAEPAGFLTAFKPNYKGYFGAMRFYTGVRSQTREKQLYWPYISGETDYASYAKQLRESLPMDLAYDYDLQKMTANENTPDKFYRRSMTLANYVFGDDKTSAAAKNKIPAAWDVILTFALTGQRLEAVLCDVFAKPDKNDFTKAFFQQYQNIKTSSDVKKQVK